MAEAGGHELIIIRRCEEEEHEHHSSAWKVAHADFMTAMMAFFLIMWLINVTDDEVRKGIAEYFNPIHLSQGSTELKGLHEPTVDQQNSVVKRNANAAPPAFNPIELTPGPANEKTVAVQSGAVAAQDAPDIAARERAAFQDAYAVLAQLADGYAADHAVSSDVTVGDSQPVGVAGGEIDRDPFDPAYWQLTPLPPARTSAPGAAGSAEVVAPDALPDAAAQLARVGPTDAGGDTPTDLANADQQAGDTLAEPAAEEVIIPDVASDAANGAAADAGVNATAAVAASLAEAINRSVEGTLGAEGSPQLSVTAGAEGVLINLTDDADFSMFAVGSAIPDAKVVVLIGEIARVLAAQPGDVVIRGFTDGRPFRNDTYDNWRLSAARAHMAYYMLTRGGLDEQRVVAIEGHADRDLRNPADAYAAENRRIEILLKAADQ